MNCFGPSFDLKERSDKRKIEAAEMRFIRPMAGCTLCDKKGSSDIREQLSIFNINDKIEMGRACSQNGGR